MDTMPTTLERIGDVAEQAVMTGMQIIRPYQCGRRLTDSEIKAGDGTLLTHVDRTVERVISRMFLAHLPNVPLIREESGISGEAASSRYVVLIDPVDGTRPLTIGAPTSTIIVAIYDQHAEQLVTTVIGAPATGQVWTARNGQTMVSWLDDGIRRRRPCRVWDGELSPSSTLLLDNFAELRKPDRQYLTTHNLSRITSGLSGRVALANFGSNGLHHALLANGNDRIVAAVTTAMGGPWDAAGGLLVLNAGGVAQGFAITAGRQLEERDPLNPFAYQLLVMANNNRTLDALMDAIAASL